MILGTEGQSLSSLSLFRPVTNMIWWLKNLSGNEERTWLAAILWLANVADPDPKLRLLSRPWVRGVIVQASPWLHMEGFRQHEIGLDAHQGN